MTSSAAEAISSATAITVELKLVPDRVDLAAPVGEGAMPATPIATSTMPVRNGRPKESLTMTPTSRPVRSPICSRMAAAEASGSTGSSTSVPGSGALEASTPAEAQTNPWRVSAITSGGRERTTRTASPRITSRWRASCPARELDRCGRRLDVVEADDAPLRLRHDLLRDDDDVGVLELDRLDDERAELVALHDLREAFDRDDAELRQRPAPPPRARGGWRRHA